MFVNAIYIYNDCQYWLILTIFGCENKYTNLTAFSKYSKASAYFSYFSSAWPTLLNSLAFLVFTFNADLKMLYSDSLKKMAKNVKQDYQ